MNVSKENEKFQNLRDICSEAVNGNTLYREHDAFRPKLSPVSFEIFKKDIQERKIFKSIRHELKRMKTDGQSQPSQKEKNKSRIYKAVA